MNMCPLSQLLQRQRRLLRGAPALRLGQKRLGPRGDQVRGRHAGGRAPWLARLGAQRRLEEAVDPARRRGVGLLVAAVVEATGRLNHVIRARHRPHRSDHGELHYHI